MFRSGPIDPSFALYFVMALAFMGAVTDLVWGRIFNWITLPSIALGLAYSSLESGWRGLGASALAIVLGFVILGWMFVIGVMGAGDVKFLMAFGAWGGVHFVLQTALFSIILGGIVAALTLLARGKLVDFARRMKSFVLSLLIRELEVEKPKLDYRSTIPFGVPIALAAAWTAGASLWNG